MKKYVIIDFVNILYRNIFLRGNIMTNSKKYSVSISSVYEKEVGFRDYRFTAKSIIEKMGMEAVRNPEDVRNQQNFENELRDNCEFFVLIMGKAPSKMVEKELQLALSKGISILVFVKIEYGNKGVAIFPENVKERLYRISPDLFSMNIIPFWSCEDLAKKLEEELQDSLFRKVKLSPLIGLDPPVAYSEGIKLIREAKYRIVLTQKTSILVLGPRKGNTDEENFYQELLNWIKQDREQSAYFIHYFSLTETKKAMDNPEYDLLTAKKNFQELLLLNNTTIRHSNLLESATHIIGDTGIGLNFSIGTNRYYLFLPCFLTKDSELNKIVSNIRHLGTIVNINDLKSLYTQ
ncbi:MAG: DUF4062 domain-containing protein [Spirochaetaceae bacterium]|jgi:hypothetical protein|nr:DUF4062 domain-containing protein [Spirochaetaceae bacterium]